MQRKVDYKTRLRLNTNRMTFLILTQGQAENKYFFLATKEAWGE